MDTFTDTGLLAIYDRIVVKPLQRVTGVEAKALFIREATAKFERLAARLPIQDQRRLQKLLYGAYKPLGEDSEQNPIVEDLTVWMMDTVFAETSVKPVCTIIPVIVEEAV